MSDPLKIVVPGPEPQDRRYEGRTYNKTIVHFKVLGQPFGLYRWKRNHNDGFVARVGPLGHVQLQFYRMRIFGHGAARRDGRRGKHGIALHFWGTSGRRRKRGVDIGVIL